MPPTPLPWFPGSHLTRTGRINAVSGGSWREYWSIQRSSSRMGPSSKAVCSEESRSRKTHCQEAAPCQPGHQLIAPVPSIPHQPAVPRKLLPPAQKASSLPREQHSGHRAPHSLPPPPGPSGPPPLPTRPGNYLSEPPWLKSLVWPGQSRHPASGTGSEEAMGGTNWVGLSRDRAVPPSECWPWWCLCWPLAKVSFLLMRAFF